MAHAGRKETEMMRMDPPRGFGTPEFQKRTATIQAAMAQEGLEGLLVMSEAEVRYFSGFHTPFWQSPTRPWFLFIPAEGAPVAVIPESSGRWCQPAFGFTGAACAKGGLSWRDEGS